MFYSQFILAKKGPLGTIWIAAHLERKLRKNQVADTDIGVSVDSILFPEVPIALRLSSHLLLGVVRIYSRKVNYLFNDCSETLVKIKQAFRSTAVDLPPEASTAPYHSITLPETFDLDDLELPESSFGQGNFVDHHVTTREQITLQDPVEDTVYLGSQFGLDERFGDGDAPQMGLDFDEDLFADRASSPGPSSAALQLEEDVLPSTHTVAEGTCSKWMEIEGQQSCTPAHINSSNLDEDETRYHSTKQPSVDHSGREIDLGFPNVLPPHVVEVAHVSSKVNHAPDLNKEISPYSTIQGPSTPRLIDETLTAEVGEMLASGSLQKNQIPNSAQGFVPVLHSQAVTSTSISISGLSKRLEQVEMPRLSQNCRPALTSSHFEEVREVDIKIANSEDVQPEKERLKEQSLLANTERIIKESHQRSIALHTPEDVNSVPITEPSQEVTMRVSKEMPTVASNSQYTASTPTLAVPTVPLPSSHSYESDVSKQQLPVHEIQAFTGSMHLADAALRAQDMSTLGFQQLYQAGDGKKQLYSTSASQGLAQVSQVHNNQQLPIHEMQASTGSMHLADSAFRAQDMSTLGFQQLNQAGDGKKQLPSTSASQRPDQVSQVHNNQQLPVHEMQASTGSMHLADAAFRAQEMSTLGFQQLNQAGDGRKQLHLTSASQGLPQISQVHNNQVSNTPVQQNPVAIPTFSTYFSGQQFNLASGLQSAVGISGSENVTRHEPSASATVVMPTFSTCLAGHQVTSASSLQSADGVSGTQRLTINGHPASASVGQSIQEASPREIRQLDNVAQSKQQLQSSGGAREYDQVTKMQNSMINTRVHENSISTQPFPSSIPRQQLNIGSDYQSAVDVLGSQERAMINTRVNENAIATQPFPTSVPRQQLNLGSDYQSAVDILGSQEPSFHGFPAPVSAISNRQELSSVNNFQLLNQEADKQQLRLAATTQECAQLKETENFVVSTTAQEFNKSMQEFPSSGKHLNLPFGHHSAISMSNTHQVPPFGSSSEPAYVSSQKFWSPQKTQVPETSSKVPSNGQTDGVLLHASNEDLNQYQSFHVSAEAEKSPLHERQHGESAAVFPSSDIHRIPTNIPVENSYVQSSSLSVPTGVQGVSKFIPDGSTATQHCNFPLESGTRESYTDVHSGNILQGTSFPWQVGTFGIHADVPSRNIFQPCSSSHAERNEISANMPSRNILLQHSDFPKVTGSQVFPTSVTASKSSVPPTSQYRTFSVASDELSNALSISQVQDVTTSKAEQFKTTQSQPEAVKRSVPEIPVHETLRSSVHIVRNEPDIFGLKRPMIGNEMPREADKNTITAKQSFGSRKRHMMDSTPVLKDVTPNSRSRLSLSSRSMDYVPHDDDVLASILGRTPSFKIKPTPAKTVAAKRPRPTPRTTGAKRKALIDIAMVIHGDVIRQQLANTEDIRRVRKKGPCTSQEIRMLQKESQAHYMFFEPSVPGLCMELHDLYSQVFGSTGAKLRQVDKDENSIETEKTQEPTSSLEPTNDSRMVQLEKARRPLERVSEMESSRVHVDSVHKSKMPMDNVYRSREHMDDDHRNQENRPLDLVTTMRSSSVRMDNVHAIREQQRPEGIVSAVQSSRVHKDGLHKEQQQESHQKYVSVLESSRVHMDDFQKEQHQESCQEFVSELESSRVHMYNAHQNRNQELPKIVCGPESSRVHMYDAQQNPDQVSQNVICEAESSRVHAGDVYREQEQERPLGVSAEMECVKLVSAIESSRAVAVAVHQKQDQERPREIVSEIEFGRAHTVDVHQKQEQEQQMPRGMIYEMESSRAHSGDVHQKQVQEQQMTRGMIYEMESSRAHSGDVHQKQVQEQQMTTGMIYEMESSRAHRGDVHQKQVQEQQMPRGIMYEMESSRAHSGDVYQKQVQEQQMPKGIIYDIESSRAHSGDVYQKQEQEQQMPKGLTYEIESSRIHVDDAQRKQTSIASFSQNPINTITGSEVSDITKTFESSMVQQGNVFANEVFVPQDNTFGGCQFPRPQDSSMFGACSNVREVYLSNNHSPLNPSCLSENHKTSLEDKVRSSLFASDQMSPILPEKHGIAIQDGGLSQSFATNLRANEGGNLLAEELEITVIKKDDSKCPGENRGMQMSQAKEGVNKEPASEFCKIIEENEPSNKEPNIAEVRREQSHEIAILGQSPLDVAKEGTFKNYESQSQGLYYSASVLTLQGKDSLRHNNDDTGELGDLTTPGNIMGASVQNFGVENSKQDEQVLMSGKLTEMSCREAEASEDVALRDREDQHGSKQVVVNPATEEDEEFDFLGDADNTEFLVGDGDAHADYEGKSNATDTEENQILENSGWSARTRAVSRYLKTVFESMDYSSKKLEAENRQKLSLDRLLVGKRRKEAARMFFETLVLKTRDYVDVEQKDSFGDIGLCPRAKLMKANF